MKVWVSPLATFLYAFVTADIYKNITHYWTFVLTRCVFDGGDGFLSRYVSKVLSYRYFWCLKQL